MHRAEALERVIRKNQKLRLPVALAALGLGLLAGAPAHSECVSPSTDAGATTTMVYPCQEEDAPVKLAPMVVDPGKSAVQAPVIVEPGKGTVVERGSADVPWFEPKTTTTADPLTTPKAEPEKSKAEPEKKVKAAKAAPEPIPVKAPEKKKAEPKEEVVNVEPIPEETPEDKPAVETKPAKKKVTKAKRTKKVAKSKRSKKLAKAKRSKVKVAQKTKTKINVAQPGDAPEQEQQVKTEPAKSDDKVILMTRKNTGVGARIKNWLGF